jgi:hypothetical protein
VFPRYDGDNLYGARHLPEPATPEERAPYGRKLRAYLESAAIEGTTNPKT